jgi:hypothetical protein
MLHEVFVVATVHAAPAGALHVRTKVPFGPAPFVVPFTKTANRVLELRAREKLPLTAVAVATAPFGLMRCTVAFRCTTDPVAVTSDPERTGPIAERESVGVTFPSVATVTRERLA